MGDTPNIHLPVVNFDGHNVNNEKRNNNTDNNHDPQNNNNSTQYFNKPNNYR